MKILFVLFLMLFINPAIAADNANSPLEITADTALEWNQVDKTYIARGNANAVQGEMSIKADILTAYYDDIGGENKIIKITADGNVVINNGKQKVSADKANFVVKTNIAEMFGNVKIEQDKNFLNGDYAEMNLTTRVSKIKTNDNKKQVKGVFFTGSDKK